MNIILIGSVGSSERALLKLIEHRMNVVGVFGYEKPEGVETSGYVNLQVTAEKFDLRYFPFQKINECKEKIQALEPDIIFVVGLSQLIERSILQSASKFCVGFHPTKLPEGRGRAPLAWLVYRQMSGAATFFEMGEGADDGPVFVQSPFDVSESDSACDVADKILLAMDDALDILLPRFNKQDFNSEPQDHSKASYFGRRVPEDGVINWNDSAADITRLVKAASYPHPGAYSFSRNERIVIWDAELEDSLNAIGTVGSVLAIEGNQFIVQTGSGLLKITDYHAPVDIRVGSKLGYHCESEIYELKQEVKKLKELISSLAK